ncbi:MAG: Holliday junction branch migration protein RuvA [Gammaproteobacteria bacterium]|nr:Holliday junction branch migration protein RuvA [Gammaproteobacteria bacterium]
MIGFIRGILAHKSPPFLLVDVHGVGYEIEAPSSTCFKLPPIGHVVHLRTHLVAREDQQTLYGFFSEDERQLFRDLLKVTGVGAKLSLAILSGISVDGFIRCVREDDKAALVRLPGVGRKTAERLIMDMRDRVERHLDGLAEPAKAGATDGGEARTEAYNALTALGYKPAEVRRMLEPAMVEGQTTEEILHRALRSAGAGRAAE